MIVAKDVAPNGDGADDAADDDMRMARVFGEPSFPPFYWDGGLARNVQ